MSISSPKRQCQSPRQNTNVNPRMWLAFLPASSLRSASSSSCLTAGGFTRGVHSVTTTMWESMRLHYPSRSASARLTPVLSSLDDPLSGLTGGEETPTRLGSSEITTGMLWRGFKRQVTSQRTSRETLTLSEVSSSLTLRLLPSSTRSKMPLLPLWSPCIAAIGSPCAGPTRLLATRFSKNSPVFTKTRLQDRSAERVCCLLVLNSVT